VAGMARTQVLLVVAALLLMCGSFCSAQTADLASQINTALGQQAAATQEPATVASTKATATPTRVSQLRDPPTGTLTPVRLLETTLMHPVCTPRIHSCELHSVV
jgi:hypothetical protein